MIIFSSNKRLLWKTFGRTKFNYWLSTFKQCSALKSCNFHSKAKIWYKKKVTFVWENVSTFQFWKQFIDSRESIFLRLPFVYPIQLTTFPVSFFKLDFQMNSFSSSFLMKTISTFHHHNFLDQLDVSLSRVRLIQMSSI